MKENPVRYRISHEEIILDAYQESKGPKGAWESLQEDLPVLPQVMRYNTFKQYITPFSKIMEQVTQRLHRNEQSRAALKETIKALRQEKNMVERRLRAIEGRRLHKVTQKEQSQAVRQGLHKEVKNIQGWTMHKAKDGYYRLHRKIKGRVHSIYLGKTLDTEKALNKISAKEKTLLGKAGQYG